MQIGCGQITWVCFGPNGTEWLAPEDDVLGQIAKAGYAGAPCGPEDERTDAETTSLYRHLCLTLAVLGINPGFICYGYLPTVWLRYIK